MAFGFLWLLPVVALSSLVAGLDFYTAGVVEFRPSIVGGSSEQLLAENLEGYLQLIAAGNGTTDILVFPEATLNTVLQLTAVPASTDQSLCDESSQDDPEIAPFLRRLACAAQEFHTYLVVNVKEKAPDEGSASGYAVYNTNVVFDRNGAVVSRYRKWNLYLESQTSRTESPELATFHTDFNVTFGHFVCFDMLFYSPAQELVEGLGVRHVIVTKMFNSELPFLTAVQFQQGWAWANKVNLLAAGGSLPQAGISGSGIYAGVQGAVAQLLITDSDEGQRKLLLARLPINPDDLLPQEEEPLQPEAITSVRLKLLQQPDVKMFSTWELPMIEGSSVKKRICQDDLCCRFEIDWTTNGSIPGYSYRMGVWVGRRRYEEEQYSSIRLCGLFACRNGDVGSCGLLDSGDNIVQMTQGLQFTKLLIEGEFVRRPRRLISPSTLSSSTFYPLQPSQLSWVLSEEQHNVTLVRMELKEPRGELMTFAIYGNYFDENAGGGGNALGNGSGVLLSVLLVLLLTIRVYLN
ncbi:vanin-like protein 3 [Drosophila bipectinata]|uniref:vanin-like protein 3 n=1 Tax=Drosophila bipectinata TaxID=42026 RepID=UPI001C8A7386|nr:vanin-like protein 3 [Drosophila bipectinata]